MAKIIWAIPALNDLEGILEYIDLDNPDAAQALALKVFEKTDRLEHYPKSGSKPEELKGTPYRRLLVGPVKIYHRFGDDVVYIVHVCRAERDFDLEKLILGDKS